MRVERGFEITRYRPEHRDGVLRLQRHLWSRDDALNRAYFAWKYEANPFLRADGGPAICIALDRGEVVGMRGIVGAKWRLGSIGSTCPIAFTDDFTVEPEHRNRGIATALVRAAIDYAADLRVPYLLSLRAGPINVLASLAAGYRSIGAMQPVALERDRRSPMEPLLRRLAGTRFLWRLASSPLLMDPAGRRPFQGIDRSAHSGGAVTVSRRPRPDAMAALHRRLPPDDRIAQVRDEAFFAWIFRNPRLEYRFLFSGGDELDGYLVLFREQPPRRRASVWIADWVAADDAGLHGLLSVAVDNTALRLATWTATFSEKALAALVLAGFEPTDLDARARGRPAALLRPTNDDALEGDWVVDGRPLLDLASWRIRLLDQD